MRINTFCKILISILILFMISIFCYNVYALDSSYSNPNRFENAGKEEIVIGSGTKAFNTKEFLTKLLGYILNILRIIALAWALIMGISIAVKYMSGSAQIKSQIKTDAPTYIIGAVLLFGATGFLTLVANFVHDVV